MLIYDGDGNEVADITISEKQRRVLETGEEIMVIYHTPQTLLYVIGERAGKFTLRREGQRIIARDLPMLRRYVDLQRAIKAAREAH
jgi:hypothetical protein